MTSGLKTDPTEWLLAQGQPWMRYVTLAELLGRPEEAPESIAARRDMLADERIRGWVAALQDEEIGIPAVLTEKALSHIKPDSFYWVLCFLGEIGLIKDDLGLDAAVDSLFALQSPGDYFASVAAGDKPICLAAVLCYGLARLGYLDDPRGRACYEHLLDLRASDGGWHCAFMQRHWKKLQSSPHTCALANLDGLRALSAAPQFRDQAAQLIDLLLRHWEERGSDYRPYNFGIGTQFRKLRYPPTPYDILAFADVLSRFPYAVKKPVFCEVVEEIVAKQDDEGRFYAESISRAWKGFDFGQKKTPSPWITLLALRVIKRCSVWKKEHGGNDV